MRKFKSKDRSDRGRKSEGSSRFKRRDSSDRPRERSDGGSRFNRRGSSERFSRDSRPRRSGGDRPEMHRVTCDKCHQKCEVPFLPTGNKPVYCSDCFRKNGGSRDSSRSNDFGSELNKINEKLDRIIEGLEL